MATFTTDNGNTIVAFSYTAPTETIISIAGGAAEYLWEHGFGDRGTEEEPITFEDLTNIEKLDLLDAYVKKVIVDLANTQKSVKAQKVARDAEEEDKYAL